MTPEMQKAAIQAYAALETARDWFDAWGMIDAATGQANAEHLESGKVRQALAALEASGLVRCE